MTLIYPSPKIIRGCCNHLKSMSKLLRELESFKSVVTSLKKDISRLQKNKITTAITIGKVVNETPYQIKILESVRKLSTRQNEGEI